MKTSKSAFHFPALKEWANEQHLLWYSEMFHGTCGCHYITFQCWTESIIDLDMAPAHRHKAMHSTIGPSWDLKYLILHFTFGWKVNLMISREQHCNTNVMLSSPLCSGWWLGSNPIQMGAFSVVGYLLYRFSQSQSHSNKHAHMNS